MVIEIEACMGYANILAATVASVLNFSNTFNTSSKIPKIEWSMSAMPDPSVFFLVPDQLTQLPVWHFAFWGRGVHEAD